jgi:hypothetical protein
MRSEYRWMCNDGQVFFSGCPEDFGKASGMVVMAVGQHNGVNHLRAQTQAVHVVKEHFGGLPDIYENVPYFLPGADLEKKRGTMLGDKVPGSRSGIVHEHGDFHKFHTDHPLSAPFRQVTSVFQCTTGRNLFRRKTKRRDFCPAAS